jgi:hypothetical protein
MRNYHRARVDDNQKTIVKYLRLHGWYILHTHPLKNACDLICVKNGLTIAVEIKDGAKTPSQRALSPGEAEFRDEWLAAGGRWELIESENDVNKKMT